MQINLATLKLEYAKDIKYYASLPVLNDEQVADLHKKARVFFDLSKDSNIDKFIAYYSPEDFINKIDYTVESIYDQFAQVFEVTEEL